LLRKYFVVLSAVVLTAISLGTKFGVTAGEPELAPRMISPNVVISQVYGGGGNTGATHTHDFVELFNRGDQPINLANYTVQYASVSGTNWLPSGALPSFNLQPGQYFLVQFASNGAVGSALPTPDHIVPVLQPEGFIPNLSSATGKVILRNIADRLSGISCPNEPSIVDTVGYGTNVTCYEGAAPAPTLTIPTAARRAGNGCTDSDQNGQDFTAGTPVPRNSSSPLNSCNLGANLQASGQASPTQVSPGNLTLLTVSVVPATTPPSTNITVTGDLSQISGSSTQQFFDDGTNGDLTAGDNVFSFLVTIPTGASQGPRILPTAVSDGQGRTINPSITLTIVAAAQISDNLALGNPSGATADPTNFTNYLMVKTQYVLSYHRDRGIPNWVGWHLDSSWIGSVGRQDDFRPDTTLPAGWYQVLDNDYSGSGFDRGHHCPSGDRTNTVANNSATFLMTNMMPQAANNNQGPWAGLEVYARELANQGNELYIIAGGWGTGGTGSQGGVTNTIANGKVTVPNKTWKIMVVLPVGDNDVDRITKNTRVIAVIMPNAQNIGIGTPWRNFRVNVKQIEALTGYNFFTNVRPQIRQILKKKIDTL
jgi:endonuclease G, mitochondrial